MCTSNSFLPAIRTISKSKLVFSFILTSSILYSVIPSFLFCFNMSKRKIFSLFSSPSGSFQQCIMLYYMPFNFDVFRELKAKIEKNMFWIQMKSKWMNEIEHSLMSRLNGFLFYLLSILLFFLLTMSVYFVTKRELWFGVVMLSMSFRSFYFYFFFVSSSFSVFSIYLHSSTLSMWAFRFFPYLMCLMS